MSEWTEKVNALADGELAGADEQEARRLVETDLRARAEYEWANFFKSELKNKADNHAAPEVWQACQARIHQLGKVGRAEHFVGRFAWAFCLIFLVGIFSAATLNRTGGSRPLATAHVAGLINGLQPWDFSGPADAMISVKKNVGAAPKAEPAQATMTSLSLGQVDGRRAARMTFKDKVGEMCLVVVSGTSTIEGIEDIEKGYRCGKIDDCNALSWTENGDLFLLYAPRSATELRELAAEIRKSR